MTTEKPCSTHPDAPHGFVRNASYNAGHYVCECSGWAPPEPRSLQERLRDGADICHARKIYTDFAGIAEEAADHIDKLEAEIQILTAEREVYAATADRAIAEIESLQLRNQELSVDAGRYQYLATSGKQIRYRSKSRKTWYAVINPLTNYEYDYEASLDAAIAAAMKESK